jgi:hypothetical protein
MSLGHFRLTKYDDTDVAAVLEAKRAMASRQALREKSFSPVWEGVMNLPDPKHGVAVLTNKKQYAGMVSAWCEKYEAMTGHRVLRADVHLDEGHVVDGKAKLNAHAHIFVDRTNEKGRVITVDATKLRKVQTMTHEVTGLERGENSLKTKRKHVHHSEYKAVVQEAKQQVAPALAMYGRLLDQRYKAIADLKAEQEALKAKYAEERAALKASGEAKQADYQRLKAAHEAALVELATLRQELAKAKDELAAVKAPKAAPEPLKPPPAEELIVALEKAREQIREGGYTVIDLKENHTYYGTINQVTKHGVVQTLGKGNFAVHSRYDMPDAKAGDVLTARYDKSGKPIKIEIEAGKRIEARKPAASKSKSNDDFDIS